MVPKAHTKRSIFLGPHWTNRESRQNGKTGQGPGLSRKRRHGSCMCLGSGEMDPFMGNASQGVLILTYMPYCNQILCSKTIFSGLNPFHMIFRWQKMPIHTFQVFVQITQNLTDSVHQTKNLSKKPFIKVLSYLGHPLFWG